MLYNHEVYMSMDKFNTPIQRKQRGQGDISWKINIKNESTNIIESRNNFNGLIKIKWN